MSFARFMNLCLNDPEAGYYAGGPDRLGARGDFFTASDVGPVLGACLARQIAEMDAAMGHPRRFRYAEYGAGRGLLARDVIDAVRVAGGDLGRRLDVVLVDASAAMRDAAAARVPEAAVLAPPGPRDALPGCVVAVELFDALPVHRIRRRDRRLVEVFVALNSRGELVEVEGEPTPEAAALAERYGAASREGSEGEVAPTVEETFGALQAAIASGYILVVDYGYEAVDLYGPAHDRGTLMAYHRHRAGEDYLDRVGEQDLTAHVNLTALRDAATRFGLAPLGTTTQDRFLVANGVLELFESPTDEAWRDPRRVRARLQAMQLIHPHAMGRAFKVAVFGKGRPPGSSLAGLRDPFGEP